VVGCPHCGVALVWKLVAAVVSLLAIPAVAVASEGASLGDVLPIWSIVPFAGLLLSIALVPLVAPHFWHSQRNQFLTALGWSAPVLAGLLWVGATDAHGAGHDALHSLQHALAEYVSFIAMLGSLYVISGGIVVRGDLRATPGVNTAFLAVGAVLANFIGTTGASMLLIRPMLRTNATRKHTWHIPVFFIFIVSNVAGLLTPLGDPPLFIGYLRGVPFLWTLQHLWPMWLFAVGALLVMFFVFDTVRYRREDQAALALDAQEVEPLSVDGKRNFWLLGGVVAAILLLSPNPDLPDFRHWYAREIAMVALAVISAFGTPRPYRERNAFTYGPILEVAALFVGIFIAMIPATKLLETHGGALGLVHPWQFFWATGALSAFLDNAPTYVTFASVACGVDPSCTTAENLAPLALGAYGDDLVGVSLGAVFCGAGSYIGNGPNFMVRAIAEQSGYKMPTFFGYCAWAALFLGPVFGLVTLIWLV